MRGRRAGKPVFFHAREAGAEALSAQAKAAPNGAAAAKTRGTKFCRFYKIVTKYGNFLYKKAVY